MRRPPRRPTYKPRADFSGSLRPDEVGAAMAARRAQPLTILHVLPWLNFGGVETYVLKLSSRQRRDGHRVLVASSGGLLEPQFAQAGIAHLRVPMHGAHLLPAAIALSRAIAREQVDLICAHNWTAGAAAYLAARAKGIAYCFTVHGTRSPFQRHFVFYWGRKVIAVSHESREQLLRDFGLAAPRVVESVIGVDTERFRPAPSGIASELGLDPGSHVVVHVSRLSHSKAPVALALIEAVPALGPGAQVLIVGDGPLAERVRAAADRMNRRLGRRGVVFAGARADIAEVLNAADVAVGTATVALEAMACGKPVVAAGKGGFVGPITPENFAHAEAVCFGDHGQPQPIAPVPLAESVSALLHAPALRRELGEAGRRAVVERFSVARMAEHVEDVYRMILADPDEVRRIVVLHLNQIGDLLFCLPALKTLRRRFPAASITSVLRPNLMDLLRESTFVDHLVARGPARQLIGDLRPQRPDLVVCFSHSPASSALAYLLGAKERIGFADAGLPWLLTRRVQVRGLPSPAKIMRLAACLGGDPSEASYVGLLRIAQADRDAASRLLADAGVGDGALIALGPTASGGRSHKNWIAERFAAVADAVAASRDAQVIIAGAAEDAPYADRIIAAMGRPALNLAGRTSAGQLAAVLERADLFIGIDSGPMHLAAAMGTPVVAVFGPSDPEQTAPQGPGHVVISKRLACSPCKWACETRDCMAEIGVEDVLQAVATTRESA